MRKILLISLLMLGGCKDGYYVFTASQYPTYERVNELRGQYPDQGIPKFMVMGRAGLSIMEFTLPTWISPMGGHSGLIITLGANDYSFGTPSHQYRAKMTEIVTQAHSQGFDDVECVVYEDYPADLVGVCDTVYTIPLYLKDSRDGKHMEGRGGLRFIVRLLSVL